VSAVLHASAFLPAPTTTRSSRALLRACRADMLRAAQKIVGDLATAEDVVQDVLAAVVTMDASDDTWRSNIYARVKYAALEARRSRSKRARRETQSHDAEAVAADPSALVVKMIARRAEHEAWTRSGAVTPEKAAELGELRAMLPEAERAEVALSLSPSSHVETISEAKLEPCAQATLRALVSILTDGEAPTAPKVAARARLSESAVRRYLTDLRRGGWIDETNNVLRTLNGDDAPGRVEPAAKVARPEHGLTEAAVRMLDAYVALVRETGRRPTIALVVDRVERDTGRRYGDTKWPMQALKRGGWIAPKTGEVLRMLDGSTPPAFGGVDAKAGLVASGAEDSQDPIAEIVIEEVTEEDAPRVEDFATLVPTADIEAEIDRARRSLITEEPHKRPRAVIPGGFIRVPNMPALARRWAGPTMAPSVLALAVSAAREEEQRDAARPRLALDLAPPSVRTREDAREEVEDPPPQPSPPVLSTSSPPFADEPARPGVDWEGWDESRARADAERAISIGRDMEDLGIDEITSTNAGFYSSHLPVNERGELSFPDPDDPNPGGRRRRRRRRS